MRNIRFNITQPSIINLVNESSFNDVSNSLSKSYELHVLNGKSIIDSRSFLIEFSEQILVAGVADNLSNFEDLFIDLLLRGSESRTAFIWTDVDNMLAGGLGDLIAFSDILSTITRKLYQRGNTHINLFIGSGSNFPLPNQL